MIWPWHHPKLDFQHFSTAWCGRADTDLDVVAARLSGNVDRIDADWRGQISAAGVLDIPAGYALQDAMRPVRAMGEQLGGDLTRLGRALSDYAAEVDTLVRAMGSYAVDAQNLRHTASRHAHVGSDRFEPGDGSILWPRPVIDGVPTRWTPVEYAMFTQRCRTLNDEIDQILVRFTALCTAYADQIDAIPWNPWWNPTGLTPTGPGNLAPPSPTDAQRAQAEAILAASVVRDLESYGGSMTNPANVAWLQGVYDRHGNDPAWMSAFNQALGVATLATLVNDLGMVATSSAPGVAAPAATLAAAARRGLATGSQDWSRSQAARFAASLPGLFGPGSPIPSVGRTSALAWLFGGSGDAASRMGPALALAMAQELDEHKWLAGGWELGVVPLVSAASALDQALHPGQELPPGVDDFAGQVFATLGYYPAESLDFWCPADEVTPASGVREEAQKRFTHWLHDFRFLDGYEGVTASLAATQPGLGQPATESARAGLIASAMTVYLGHNADLGSTLDHPVSPLTDKARVNIVAALAPYSAEFELADTYDRNTPSLSPSLTDEVTHRAVPDYPQFDKAGLRALVGQSGTTEQGMKAWTVAIVTNVETDMTMIERPDQADRAQARYFWTMGYVGGAEAEAEVAHGAAKDAQQRIWIDLTEKGLDFGASQAAGKIHVPVLDKAVGHYGPQLINALIDRVSSPLTQAEAQAQATACESASQLWGQAPDAWNQLSYALRPDLPPTGQGEANLHAAFYHGFGDEIKCPA